MNRKHVGSTLESFFKKTGQLAQVRRLAKKKIAADDVDRKNALKREQLATLREWVETIAEDFNRAAMKLQLLAEAIRKATRITEKKLKTKRAPPKRRRK